MKIFNRNQNSKGPRQLLDSDKSSQAPLKLSSPASPQFAVIPIPRGILILILPFGRYENQYLTHNSSD